MSIPTTANAWNLPKPTSTLADLAIAVIKVPSPKANEVLIKVHAVSLNYRDLLITSGKYPVQSVLPDALIPCSDMAGQIVALGSSATKFSLGQRVSVNMVLKHISGDSNREMLGSMLGAPLHGVLAEYVAFPEEAIVTIPEHLRYEEASTLPCAALTAWQSFFGSVRVKPTDAVLVQGTGGVALFGVQLAAAVGATVIVTSSSDDKLAFAKTLGAKHGINYRQTPDWETKVLELTNGRGVDHILDLGGASTLVQSADAVRVNGHIHVVGVLAAGDLSSLPIKLIMSSINIHGIGSASRVEFEAMNSFLAEHKIRPVVDRVFEFEEAREALEYLQAQKHVGKIVIRVAN